MHRAGYSPNKLPYPKPSNTLACHNILTSSTAKARRSCDKTKTDAMRVRQYARGRWRRVLTMSAVSPNGIGMVRNVCIRRRGSGREQSSIPIATRPIQFATLIVETCAACHVAAATSSYGALPCASSACAIEPTLLISSKSSAYDEERNEGLYS